MSGGYIPGIRGDGTVSPTTTAATIRSNIAAVGGSLGSTDNRVLRADGTSGSTAQGSAVTIDDSGNVSGVGTFTASGTGQFGTKAFIFSDKFGISQVDNNYGLGSVNLGFFSGNRIGLNRSSGDPFVSYNTGTGSTLLDCVFGGAESQVGYLGSVVFAATASSARISPISHVCEQRNGTTAQKFCVANTWTSSTVNELFEIDWRTTANECWLTTRKGSGGGSARDLVIGRDGVERLRATSSGVTTSGTLNASSWITGGTFGDAGTWASANGVSGNSFVDTYGSFRFSPGSSGPILRAISGVVTVRNAANSADSAFGCSNLTASGTITHVPASSVTLGTNGQFSIEMTSNTAGNLVYRGSDGVTRRMALTFS